MLPAIHAPVFKTVAGTPYLREPGVVMIARPEVDLEGIQPFLDGFDSALDFSGYLRDDSHTLDPAEQLVKFAGQLCYMSLGPERTWNRDAGKYFDNIRKSSHGSVLEHAKFSFLVYGCSRSFTHELVRHRTGVAYSQVSQRYVDGKKLRFVERPEYTADPFLHGRFEQWIDRAVMEYDDRAAHLAKTTAFPPEATRTEKRKAVNQAARASLPNETEAPIVFSGNVRAMRHVVEMRAAKPAEPEIRRITYRIYQCLVQAAPLLFGDYRTVDLGDGTHAVETDTRKV